MVYISPAPSPLPLTRLTVLTVSCNSFSPMAVILIVRLPNRPSRPKAISIPSGANLPSVRCASRPLRSVRHELAHTGRHRVGVDHVLDRVAPVVGISRFEGARRSKCALAGCGPECKIGHARQALEAYAPQHA